MLISISDPISATYIFTVIFIAALLLSIRSRNKSEIFSKVTTSELKGLAILLIIFSHIGYFLVSDHRFLFPLSTMAGVGVNLFLFLSGFGLALSSLRKEKSVWQYHGKRILKFFVPLWITLTVFYILDYFLLHSNYSWTYIFHSFAGFFSRADLYADIDSPLWYISLILFYYLIFPILFLKKYPWLSSILIYVLSYLIIYINPDFLSEVMRLYEVHILAFPLGVMVGGMIFYPNRIRTYLAKNFDNFVAIFSKNKFIVNIFNKSSYSNSLLTIKKIFGFILVAGLLIIVAYTAINSGIGGTPKLEQTISLITTAALVILFLLKKFDIKLLYIFGLYSYEIFLFHWPILSRYDFLFKSLPAWLATTLYLVLFLILAWILKKCSKVIYKLLHI